MASKKILILNLVTATAWPAHPAWRRKFLTLLGSQIEA